MSVNLKSTLCTFLAFFICTGAGSLYAKQNKTVGEKTDQIIDKTAKTVEKAEDKARESAKDLRDKGSQVAEDSKNKAQELRNKAKEKAHEGIDRL